jgi:hypothetical protein
LILTLGGWQSCAGLDAWEEVGRYLPAADLLGAT